MPLRIFSPLRSLKCASRAAEGRRAQPVIGFITLPISSAADGRVCLTFSF